MSQLNVSRCSRAVRNVQKKHDARAKLFFFSYEAYFFFGVPLAIGVVVA